MYVSLNVYEGNILICYKEAKFALPVFKDWIQNVM